MTVAREAGPPTHRIGGRVELPRALEVLGVPRPRPVLVCTGGAAGMDDDDSARFASLVRDHLVPVLERREAVVVDGGTDSGVMRVLGQARRDLRAGFTLLGVTAEGTVRFPGEPAGTDRAEPEPNHSAVLLVPGARWGDESPWIATVAGLVAAGGPSATLVANGGDITYRDAENSVAAHRPVVVVARTGRTADAIARAAAGSRPSETDPRATRLARSGLVTVVHLDRPEELARAVDAALSAGPGGPVTARP